MKFNRISLVAALLITLAIVFIVWLYSFMHDQYAISAEQNSWLLIGISFVIFFINIIAIEKLFRYYAKHQILRMSQNLPPDFISESDKIGFKELGEKISGLNERNITELDMMKEMESYRKEYIGNVSHEMKTPLFSIQGYLETLKDGGVNDLEIRDKYLERISISVERLINIVTDLDMINRYEAGEISLNITKFDINAMVREVFDLLDLDAQKKRAVLSLETTQSQIFVKADKQKISQVLINLVSNAIHYSNRENASIIMRTSILKNKVLVMVEDNGMGIKAEILPRIFERFYRVETSRNRRAGGSVLGLAIVKHILDAHNENISVESEYLEGTKFSFLLDKA